MSGKGGKIIFIKRVLIIVLDGAGVGALPDADQFGDQGSNTLGHVILKRKKIHIPNLYSLGLGRILNLQQTNSGAAAGGEGNNGEKLRGAFGKMAEVSPGKDTTTGHWELAGLVIPKAFPVYPQGFPAEVITAFERLIGRKILGNIPFSGTEIIKIRGAEHLQTGFPIVYTSADSVFQVAAHEEVVPLETLYHWCLRARQEILIGPHAVARVIARPFLGASGHFFRTKGRRDFSLPPPGPTLLDHVKNSGHAVCAIGKIKDIFAGQGVTGHLPAADNSSIGEAVLQALQCELPGLIWANFVDFDMLYGHRNDPAGFAGALEEFDLFLGKLLKLLKSDDMLLITADHGCDPTFKGTDHTREYVPLLVYGEKVRPVDLGIRTSFADLGATAAEVLGCKGKLHGQSFTGQIFPGQTFRGRKKDEGSGSDCQKKGWGKPHRGGN